MRDKFYVTTPIYYTNWIPHIGHSYSSIIADSLARFYAARGARVKFATGVDENSQKAVLKAEEEGMKVEDYLDKMAGLHKWVWDGLGISYTDFIRTTEERHHDFVRKVLQKSFDNGDIYEGEYEGMYCVGCEAFKKDEDLIKQDWEKVCPDHLKAPDKIKEKNYFFKLSKYQDYLEKFYEENPDFIVPSNRFNEVKEFVKRGLEDFSISRETNKFGIKLPFDEDQVTYVWYDALFNYLTVCQNDLDENGKEKAWPADVHVIGKDIVRFHAIYWPAMLKSAGYEEPKQLLVWGHFTVDGQKISKSLGNAIDPVEFVEKYNKDLLILYILSAFPIGSDGDFDQKQAILTFNAKLANNLGNLLNRSVVLTLKKGIETLEDEMDENISLAMEEYKKTYEDAFARYDLREALNSSFEFLDKVNKYIDENEPWKMIKDESLNAETNKVLYNMCESLRVVGISLYPFFEEKMLELFERLGLWEYRELLKEGKALELLNEKGVFKITEKGEPLFARLDTDV